MKSPNRITFLNWKPAAVATVLCAAAITLIAIAPARGETPGEPFNWTGFYIGLNVGGSLSDYEFHGSGDGSDGHLFSDVDIGQQIFGELAGIDVVRFFDASSETNRTNHEERRGSILGGGQIGYQHQFGHFVVGIEGDFDRTSARGSADFKDNQMSTLFDFEIFQINADTDFTGMRSAQSNWIGSVRGKFGYATGPFLFYGTAGVAFTEVNVWAHDVAKSSFTLDGFFDDGMGLSVVDLRNPGSLSGRANGPAGRETSLFLGSLTNTKVAKDDDTLVGWTAGGGVEVAFNQAVSLALEYRHNGFGNETYHFPSSGPIFPGGTRVDFDTDQVTVKMNILLSHFFGHDNYASAKPVNTMVAKSPFGGEEEANVAYTAKKEQWAGKDKIVEVEQAQPFDWTGFYVGANVGGVWTDYDFGGYDSEVDVGQQFYDQGPTPFLTPFETPSLDGGSDDSLLGGGQVGYQYQFGHFVFGVEGDFTGQSSGSSTEFASSNFNFVDGDAIAVTELTTMRKATVDWTASARARLGYARGPVLLYVTGGGVWSQVRTWSTDRASSDFFVLNIPPFAGTVTNTNNTNDEDTIAGWTAGGGVEWAFSKIATVGLEYRHNDYGDMTAHYDPHRGPIYSTSNKIDIDSDQVTLRVNFLLGHMGPGH